MTRKSTGTKNPTKKAARNGRKRKGVNPWNDFCQEFKIASKRTWQMRGFSKAYEQWQEATKTRIAFDVFVEKWDEFGTYFDDFKSKWDDVESKWEAPKGTLKNSAKTPTKKTLTRKAPAGAKKALSANIDPGNILPTGRRARTAPVPEPAELIQQVRRQFAPSRRRNDDKEDPNEVSYDEDSDSS